jgi:nucleotide-binding universal stress UspA family protein
VVGVDGGPASLAALRFAADWASRRHCTVDALYAVDAKDQAADAAGVEARLHEWCAGVPGADVRPRVVAASAREALVAAAGSASLVVVGSRGRGELRSLVLGSVGYALVLHGESPVAIVHVGS